MANIVVVGVDRSQTSARAAAIAARVARDRGARLHVLCAYDKLETREIGEGSDSWIYTSVDEATEVAMGVAAQIGDALEVSTSAAQGKPQEVLIEEAARLSAELIVVGNKGTHGFGGRVLGSIATAVVNHAPCDVYVAKTT